MHLIGHDWGSTTGWEATTDPAMAGRLAGFTTISAPCLAHVGGTCAGSGGATAGHCAASSAAPGISAWYIGLFQLPRLAPLVWRYGLAGRWPRLLARLEGQPLPLAPGWREDGRQGIKLYRANVLARLWHPRPRPALVPVHATVARRDPFVGAGFISGLAARTQALRIDEIEAGHWAIASQARRMAALIAAYLEARAQPPVRPPST